MKKLAFLLLALFLTAYPALSQSPDDLIKAIKVNDLNRVDEYLKKGGTTNLKDTKNGFNLAHLCAFYGRAFILSLLVNYRNFETALIRQIPNSEKYAVFLGAFSDLEGAEKFLKRLPKSLSSEAYIAKGNYYYVVVGEENSRNSKKLQELLKIAKSESVSPNARSKNGNTPLHIAVWKGYVRTATMLVKLGADPFAKNSAGITPYDIAKMKNLKELISLFESKKAR